MENTHDYVIKWKHFPSYWLFVWGIHRPMTRSFDVFFNLRMDKRLSKQSWGWWFEKPSRPLRRHSNARAMTLSCLSSFLVEAMYLVIHFWGNFHCYFIKLLCELASGSTTRSGCLHSAATNCTRLLMSISLARYTDLNQSGLFLSIKIDMRHENHILYFHVSCRFSFTRFNVVHSSACYFIRHKTFMDIVIKWYVEYVRASICTSVVVYLSIRIAIDNM